MTLFDDKAVLKILDELITYRRKSQFTSKISPRLSFICGEQILDKDGKFLQENIHENNIRLKIVKKLEHEKYILSDNRKSKVLCVISEVLYSGSSNLLTFEEILADLSDDIVIVVESPGTYCELGAFSLAKRYLEKLIIINEDRDDYKDSFITKGPIEKILAHNTDNVIFHDGKQCIDSSLHFKKAIQVLSNKPVKIMPNNDSDNLDPKMLMYELTCLIELFQPISEFEIEYVYIYINKFVNYNISNRNKNKFVNIKRLLEQMIELKMIYKEDLYLFVDNSISCYDTMFAIDRKKFNDFRVKYINIVYKKEPFRIRGDQDELSG